MHVERFKQPIEHHPKPSLQYPHIISKGTDRDTEWLNFQPAATHDIVTGLDSDLGLGMRPCFTKQGSRVQHHSTPSGFLFVLFFSQSESSHTHKSPPPHPVVARVAEDERHDGRFHNKRIGLSTKAARRSHRAKVCTLHALHRVCCLGAAKPQTYLLRCHLAAGKRRSRGFPFFVLFSGGNQK